MYRNVFANVLYALASVQLTTAYAWEGYSIASRISVSVPATATATTPITVTSATSTPTSTSVASMYISTKGVGSSVNYAVNIPSPGSSDLFIQITGPSSMSWIGLGQGDDMNGANMFIIYANAAGTNVTLSGRQGQGQFQPTAASNSALTLLAGSGIANGVMTANILCTNCGTWTGGSVSYTSTSTPWIWAYKSGSPISSDSTSAVITYHTSHGSISFDLAASTGGASRNPFFGTSLALTGPSGSDSDNDVSASSFTPISPTLILAHGVLGSLAFITLFPLGTIILRLLTVPSTVVLHASVQLTAYIVALCTLGTGIYLASTYSILSQPHPILGILVISILFVQPFLGLLHHILFKRSGQRTAVSWIHIWVGRIGIVAGGINGGLGLALGRVANSYRIAYWVVAGVMWALWGLAILVGEKRKRIEKQEGDKRRGSSQSRKEVN